MSKEKNNEIVVNDIEEIRPQELPLVVQLPEGASEAQVAFAATLNAYAYQNRAKWNEKKEVLIAKLKSLANAPAPQPTGLKINKSDI